MEIRWWAPLALGRDGQALDLDLDPSGCVKQEYISKSVHFIACNLHLKFSKCRRK